MWIQRVLWVLLLLLAAGAFLVFGLPVLFALTLTILVLPLLSLLLCRAFAGRLKASLSLKPTGMKQRAISGTLRLENPTLLPFGPVACRLLAENRSTGEAERFTLRLAPGPKTTAEVPVEFTSAHCGRLDIRLEELRAYDLFRVGSRRRAGGAACALTILPDTFTTTLDFAEERMARPTGDEYTLPLPGHDLSEAVWIREYQEGDSPRAVHWKLSSKLDKLMVRQPGRPAENSVLILYEHSLKAPGRRPKAAVCDAMAEALFSVSQALADQEITHQVAWQDHDTQLLNSITLGSAADMLGLLPRVLAARMAGDGSMGSCAEAYLKEADGACPAHIIYITPFVPEAVHQLAQQAQTTVLLCQGKAGDGPSFEGSLATFPFTPGEYQNELAWLMV